jgi:hypothetical protein
MEEKKYFNNAVESALQISTITHDIDDKIKNITKLKNINDNIKLDEFNHIYTLELKSKVADIISAQTGFIINDSSDAFLMHQLSHCLITSQNKVTALTQWQKIKGTHKNYHNTIHAILALPHEYIHNMYNHTQDFCKGSEISIINDVISRIYSNYGHTWNDDYEIKQTAHPSRSLHALRTKGLRITLDTSKIPAIKKIAQINPFCPILEQIKNERCITINGFKNSKASLPIHDSFDHFWTYDLLEKNGILKKYADFLQKVGNPHTTDMFSREGELIASAAYEYRFSYLAQSYHSIINYDQLIELFKNNNNLTNNQKEAYATLMYNKNNENFTQYLSKVISGIHIELMEQRRKHGFIKILDKNFKPIDILQTLDLEYISLIIDIHKALNNEKNNAFYALYSIMLIFEEYLHQVTHAAADKDLIITLKDIEKYDIKKSSLSREKISWLKENIGSLATRKTMCNQKFHNERTLAHEHRI